MSSGFLKIALLQIESEYFHADKQFYLRMIADDATYTYTPQMMKQSGQKAGDHLRHWNSPTYQLFPLSDHFQIKLFQNQETDTRFGYFKIPMAKLYDLPQKNHMINTRCVWIQKSDNSVNTQSSVSASVKLSIVYLNHAVGTLLLDIKEANLIRDTEAIGKMDPFLECKIGDVSSKTDIADSSGKNPVWNQVLSFLLESIPSQINFIVKDQDMVSDDIVGSVCLNPQQENILRQTKKPIQKDIQLLYEGKKAGTLKISTYLTLSVRKQGEEKQEKSAEIDEPENSQTMKKSEQIKSNKSNQQPDENTQQNQGQGKQSEKGQEKGQDKGQEKGQDKGQDKGEDKGEDKVFEQDRGDEKRDQNN